MADDSSRIVEPGRAPADPPEQHSSALLPRARNWKSDALVGWCCAGLVALASWWPLAMGHGLIGGDVYTYFFPLKAWYGDHLRHGELSLWNSLIGNGMPALGESQTGIFYPLNLVLYALLPLNAAYNASFLIHYVLAFGFTFLYLRRLGSGVEGALLGALVFVYGWFPARSCLEWAITTGAWIPLVLWGVECFLVEGRARYWLVTTLALAIQLLAGHFNLAFITHLTVLIYVPLRLLSLGWKQFQSWGRLAAMGLCGCLAVGIAAIQLVPSWELKNRSQRREPSIFLHDLGYGRVPLWYLSQAIFPWQYYPDVKIGHLGFGFENTNQVEAHLYFGQLPLLLVVVALVARWRRSVVWIWLFLSGLSLAMVPGWWTDLLSALPGFSYFTGPGRYGIVAEMGVAVLAAHGLDVLLCRMSHAGWRWGITAAALLVTWLDLEWVAEAVQFRYVRMVNRPPISLRAESLVARRLRPTDRVLSRTQNAITLSGSPMLPIYLGIGPAEYYRSPTKLPDEFRWDGPLSEEVLDWLRHAGVTHVLAFEPHPDWPCELIWKGYDPMLHPMLGRDPHELFWLYHLNGALGRAYWIPADEAGATAGRAEHPIDDVIVGADRVDIRVDLTARGTVVLTDLDFPGWQAEIDDIGPVEAQRFPPMYRSLEVAPGHHTITWKYRPRSAIWGGMISVGSLAVTLLVTLVLRGGRPNKRSEPLRVKNPAVRTWRNGGAGTEKRPNASGRHPQQCPETPPAR